MTNTNNKPKTTTYYLIRNHTIGKRKDGSYYLFKNGSWVPDTKNTIIDRLMGFDPSEPEGSPYRTGNMSIIDEIETISEEQALKLIDEQGAQHDHRH